MIGSAGCQPFRALPIKCRPTPEAVTLGSPWSRYGLPMRSFAVALGCLAVLAVPTTAAQARSCSPAANPRDAAHNVNSLRTQNVSCHYARYIVRRWFSANRTRFVQNVHIGAYICHYRKIAGGITEAVRCSRTGAYVAWNNVA